MNHRHENSPQPAEVSDETLMAYADGQLGPRDTQALRSRLAGDPLLRQRLTAFVATRDLAPMFCEAMVRPVPESLRAALSAPVGLKSAQQGAGRTPASAAVGVGLLRTLTNLLSPGRGSWTLGVAFSSCLIVGSVGGWLAARLWGGDAPASLIATASDGSGITSRLLAAALESRPSRTSIAGLDASGRVLFTVTPRATFPAKGDRVCREYDVRVGEETRGQVGVACRESAGRWTVEAQVVAEIKKVTPDQGQGKIRPAAGSPLDSVVEQLASGPTLDQAQEARALANGWSMDELR